MGSNSDELDSEVRADIHKLLKECGGDVADVVKLCLEGMKACKRDSDGDETDEPNWNVRVKYGTLLATMLGYMKQGSVEVNVGMSQEEREVGQLYDEWRKEQRKQASAN